MSPIPSFEKAKYVVETAAGFCDKFEIKEGFTILGDLSKCEPLPEDVDKLNQEIQGWLMAQGCRKVAQLVGDINVMSQVNAFAEKSGMREILRAFFYVKGAELWLDMN